MITMLSSLGSKAINIDNWEVVDLPPKLIQTKQPEVIFAPIAGKNARCWRA
ncbi:Uncharacterised protein [Providencia rustigianii]|nr:Uncharacterised protein [Providencia rustigianii]